MRYQYTTVAYSFIHTMLAARGWVVEWYYPRNGRLYVSLVKVEQDNAQA